MAAQVNALGATLSSAPWLPHSQHLPKTSRSSFSISRTIQPQNTELSLEGVSKSKGIWVSLWAPQHIKSLMLCKKLVCSSGTELPQVQSTKAFWNNKLERNSLYCKTSDILNIYICWPQISALHPFSQALAVAGAEHTVALTCRARQLPKHRETQSTGALKPFSQQAPPGAAAWRAREHGTVLFRSYSGTFHPLLY